MTGVRLLVFARAPLPGAAKTRLEPALGAVGAARLQARLTVDAVARGAASAPARLELWQAGDDPRGFLRRLARRFGAALRRQPDGDLGTRMQQALASATADGRPALLMGTDCPDLDATALRAAAAALDTHDAVLGPAADGGYVLVGLHRAEPALFRDIAWGTGRVLACTRARLAGLGWRWHELPVRADIDRPGDLALLARRGPGWARRARPRA